MIGRLSHLWIVTALLLAGACARTRPDQEAPDATLVPVSVAVRIGNVMARDAATRGNAAVITEMDQTFRGMTEVTLVPFDVRGRISSGDLSIFHPAYLSDITPGYYSKALEEDGASYVSGLVMYSNAHLYPKSEAYLPCGMASALVYGRPPVVEAATAVEQNHLNGALAVSGLAPQSSLRTAGEISFSPVPICEVSIPVESEQITSVLNEIASALTYTTSYRYEDAGGIWNTGSVTLSWNDSIKDAQLRELFEWFTNDGHLCSEAGHNVEYMISRLYRILKEDYTSYDGTPYEHVTAAHTYPAMLGYGTTPLTYAILYNGIRDEIVRRIEALRTAGTLEITSDNKVLFASESLSRHPESYGLPDGAAVMRWNGISFVPVTQALDGVAPLMSYCYPPDLWYFVNTTLSTSTQDRESVYTQDNPSWKNDILPTYRSGKILHSDTKSAALDSALQYSCAMLVATVRASGETLDDGDGLLSTQVSTASGKLPVTGVIVGSQRTLGFDFTPTGTTDYFLYDNCISNVFLTRTELASAPQVRTLVSQTPDREPVYFSLELRNDTGEAFTGADGLIMQGAKFYLVGSIELPDDDSFARAFERGHITRINCLVTSLAEARTAIPDLEHPHLSAGLQVNVNWKESTPTYLILD